MPSISYDPELNKRRDEPLVKSVIALYELLNLVGLDDSNIAARSLGVQQLKNPYKASAYRASSSQAISATTWTKVQLNAENYDTNNNFDSTTNYRYTAPVAGYYVVTGAVECDTATRLTSSIYVNGSIKQRGDDVNAGGSISIVAGIIYLAANDYVELYVFSGSANNVVAVQADTNMSIHLLSL